MGDLNMWENTLFRFFLVWYACGVILLSFNILPPWLEWANTVFLITAGTLGVIYFCKCYGNKHGLFISMVVFVVSMTSEYLGTTYGWIFGKYIYNADFGIKLFDVPITIGFAWLLVMSSSHAFLQTFQLPTVLSVIYGGLIAVVMDLIIDPVAYVVKSYWVWQESGPYYDIPTQNFFGWFFVAAALHIFLLFYQKPKQNHTWAKRIILVYVLIISMFLLLALLAKLYLAVFVTLIGSALILFHYYKKRSVSV
jgi:putative membrane protein